MAKANFMKNIKKIIFVYFIFFAYHSYSQDAIVKINKNIIKCKVTEISDDVLIYTLPDAPDVSYTIRREEVYIIVFNDGVFEKINETKISQNIPNTTINFANPGTPSPSAGSSLLGGSLLKSIRR